jgi:hypothetical protein
MAKGGDIEHLAIKVKGWKNYFLIILINFFNYFNLNMKNKFNFYFPFKVSIAAINELMRKKS